MTGWQLEIGNFSYIMPGVKDPRPTWSLEPRPLAAPSVTLAGNVWYPVPPVDGQFQQSTDVEVGRRGRGQGVRERISGSPK